MPIIRILGAGAPLIVAVKGTDFATYTVIILVISVLIGGFYSYGVDIIVKNKK